MHDQPAQLLDGVGRGQYHLNNAFRVRRRQILSAAFFDALVDETDHIRRDNRPSSVATGSHITNWTKPFGTAEQYSLKNATGHFDDFSSDHTNRHDDKAFHHATDFPVLGAFINAWPWATNFRLNVMGPDSGLSLHEETVIFGLGRTGYRAKVRFHLPLITNPAATVSLDGEECHLPGGGVYQFNNGCIHAAGNLGSEARAHLVWDCWFSRAVWEHMTDPSQDWALASDAKVPVKGTHDFSTYELRGTPDLTVDQWLDRDPAYAE